MLNRIIMSESRAVLEYRTLEVRLLDAMTLSLTDDAFSQLALEVFEFQCRWNDAYRAFASNGAGTLSHLTAALFMQQARIDMLHVPYKSAAPAVIAAAAGEVPMIFSAYPSVSIQIQAGKLRGLAVTSAKRIAAAPALPTIAEAALPGFESTQWWGFYAPAAAPADIVARLNREMNLILATAETRKRLAAEGAEPAGGSPADLGAYHRADYERWEKVIRAAGIKAD